MSNRLAHATSPYLKQHADNPVDWYEWGQEAWDKSKAENKPVFLSVGYSSCHWCHVMAHESFEDQTIADILNLYFVNIKLDREERPDIDDVYMTAVQLATGHGGWPMSVFLTPDKKPFFVGTYFPKESREGYPSFETLLINLSDAWQTQEAEIREKADEFSVGLKQVLERSVAPVTGQIDTALIDQSIQQLHSSFDYEDGGFGEQPKFPPHALLRYLMEYSHKRHHLPGSDQTVEALTEDAGHMTVLTLRRMAQGGIHDVVGGGFHRYSTDSDWLLPHFEKMLYDNGQLLWLYSTAVELVDDEEMQRFFQSVCNHLVGWIDREMTAPSGHLYSALDADSNSAATGHAEEGAFYVWTFDELKHLVGEDLARTYNAHPHGNFSDESSGEQTGKCILHTHHPVERPLIFDELLKNRSTRPRPGLDNKCLCSSNGLMISGLVKAGALLQAEKIARAWMSFDPNVLPHQVVDGQPQGDAFLDDYAFLADGIIDLASATQNQEYAQYAESLVEAMISNFAPNGQSGFNFTSSRHELLFGQTRPAMDNATPSPNGVAIRALRKLGRSEEALHHLSALYGWAQRLPQASATLLEECFHQLLSANQEAITAPSTDSKKIDIRLVPEFPSVATDGFAYTDIVLDIPSGQHINSHEPTADWLTPTTVIIEGVYGEASFPPSESGEFTGQITIPLRLKPKSLQQSQFKIQIGYQVCSDTECFLPTFESISGSIS